MKPNDQAYQAALRATSDSCSAYQIQNALDAAYAVQFQPSEDYAGLVKELREWAGQCEGITLTGEKIIGPAADAIEALLAERDALKAERDALLARLAPVDDEALVEIAVQAGYKAEYEADMSVGQAEAIFVETVYKPLSIYKPIMTAAIAAIRPHIEAAERERIKSKLREIDAASRTGGIFTLDSIIAEIDAPPQSGAGNE